MITNPQRCACVHTDPYECARIRDRRDYGDPEDDGHRRECECVCHDLDDDDFDDIYRI